ncbi:MAG: T9SS type A sorting domain-containing protein, partial [Bacteroidetes bacterium]|nr:T9SS type A sorting domain-containing protein [Bacteroidota bacterium]
FGDGNTSTLQNPAHTYAAAGSYNVTLTVNNIASCEHIYSASVDILSLPLVPADPTSTELACQGKTTVFTTAGGTYATEYAWELLPVGAGTVSDTTPSATVTWDAAYTGPASIKVKSLNECGESAYSGEFSVTVQPVPALPGLPAGEAQIDSYKYPSSDFTTTGADHALTYEWTVDPANAGTFTGTGLTGTITWDPSYRGMVNIHTTGINDCGLGIVSDPFEVEIFSTMSINDLNSPLAMEIFPNPSKGKFTFSIQTKDNLSVNLRVLNPLGTAIFSEQNIRVNGKLTKVVDLSQESDGIYFVILENSKKNIIRKIMIQK